MPITHLCTPQPNALSSNLHMIQKSMPLPDDANSDVLDTLTTTHSVYEQHQERAVIADTTTTKKSPLAPLFISRIKGVFITWVQRWNHARLDPTQL